MSDRKQTAEVNTSIQIEKEYKDSKIALTEAQKSFAKAQAAMDKYTLKNSPRTGFNSEDIKAFQKSQLEQRIKAAAKK